MESQDGDIYDFQSSKLELDMRTVFWTFLTPSNFCDYQRHNQVAITYLVKNHTLWMGKLSAWLGLKHNFRGFIFASEPNKSLAWL